MTRKALLSLLVCAFALLPWQAAAQDDFYKVAPVQVEMSDGQRQYSLDCYPSAPPENDVQISVYFNTQGGLAIYACHLVGRVVIWPAVSSFRGFNLAGWFGPVPKGGDA